ncbi:MAG TPA: hypothetical protein VKN99_19530 [Polyangia bacterium]|nr:hypothetical protein [Polyangia bacterium]
MDAAHVLSGRALSHSGRGGGGGGLNPPQPGAGGLYGGGGGGSVGFIRVRTRNCPSSFPQFAPTPTCVTL